MMMIFQMAMNKFSGSLKVCRVKNRIEHFEKDMWAIE